MPFGFGEEVEAGAAGRALGAIGHGFLFGSEPDRVVSGREGAREDQLLVLDLGRRAARVFPFFVGFGDGPLRGFGAGLAPDRLLRTDQVRFPVVEVQLRRGPDLVDGALGVGDVGQADRDVVLAEAGDLGLGDAELVDPLADDLDRAFDVGAGHFLDLPGRRALVDQLDPALEVEAEAGRLAGDDEAGDDDQAEDEEQDEQVFAPGPHAQPQLSGVRTISRPPSSS